MSETEALLRPEERSYPQSRYSGPGINSLANGDELSTTVSTGVFKSRSLLQKPRDNSYVDGIPIWRASMLVVNAALGAGILNFPQAYAECGDIVTAIATQMVITVVLGVQLM